MIGDPSPIRSEAPMMTITAPVAQITDAVVGFFGRKLSFKQRQNGTLLIGGGYRGTVCSDGLFSKVDVRALGQNMQTVVQLFPQLATVPVIRSWAGVEAMTPDGIPIISASLNEEGLFHAFGFSSHGFQLGPVVGVVLADLIEKGVSNFDINPFRIDRFSC